jgi:hypothetical protein
MKAPRYIAAFVCLFVAFAMLQNFMWHWRPEPGWQPSWWQSRALATFGFLTSMPAVLPLVILMDIGFTNIVIGWLAIAFGVIAEFVLIYVVVYFPTRYLFRRIL